MLKRLLLVAAASIALLAPANAVKRGVGTIVFEPGDTITFRNPYKTGCEKIEEADANWNESYIVGPDGKFQMKCWKLNADEAYKIVEVQQYKGREFYRIDTGPPGDPLMWTYIRSSRDIYESVVPGSRLVGDGALACYSLGLLMAIVAAQGRGYGQEMRANCVTGGLPTGSVLEVQKVEVTGKNNFYRWACVATYEAGIPPGPNRPCVWMRHE